MSCSRWLNELVLGRLDSISSDGLVDVAWKQSRVGESRGGEDRLARCARTTGRTYSELWRKRRSCGGIRHRSCGRRWAGGYDGSIPHRSFAQRWAGGYDGSPFLSFARSAERYSIRGVQKLFAILWELSATQRGTQVLARRA